MYKGDSIYITKTNVFKFEDGQINSKQWINLVESDDSLIWLENLPDGKIYNNNGLATPEKETALWFSNLYNSEADLAFTLGMDNRFVFGFGHDANCLRKILEVAERLGGFVQTDLGYILSEEDAVDMELDAESGGYED
jgi:hypothetical protein